MVSGVAGVRPRPAESSPVSRSQPVDLCRLLPLPCEGKPAQDEKRPFRVRPPWEQAVLRESASACPGEVYS
jgi:hypothetical protein